MRIEKGWVGFSKAAVLSGVLLVGAAAFAQQDQQPVARKSGVPDAQVEANVLKALAGKSELAGQDIQSSTVYGTVTLSGTVSDDAARQMADDVTSRVAGVQKVVDEMEVGGAQAQAQQAPDQGQQNQNEQMNQQGPPPPGQRSQGSPYPQTGYPGAPEYPQGQAGNYPPQQQGQPGYPQQRGNYPPQGYPQQGQGYPPQGGPQQGFNAPPPGREPYGSQRAGDTVTIPPGSLLRIRINEGLSSNHNQPGAMFDGVVLNDVVADGAIAIPRGASVQGTVITAKSSGAVSGRGELTLQLTGVILGGKSFPLNSDTWSQASGDKTAHTVNNAIGLGVLGAIIGGVAGGGSGAAIGAAAGGATGVAASAASPKGQVMIPAEAMLTFHIAAPTTVVTVSQAEMDRLGYGMPSGGPAVRRRTPPPPPYYARPYPY